MRDLTDRHRSVLDLLVLGRTNRQIGQELYLSEKTIKNYVSDLFVQLGVSNRTEAAAHFHEHGAPPSVAEREWEEHVASALRLTDFA